MLHAGVADARPESLRVVAVYERAAGLGHVVLDGPTARAHAGSVADGAVFVAGAEAARRSLARYAAARPGVSSLSRAQYLDTVHAANQDQAWAVWLIIGMSVAFAALALVNTAAMATSERRDELATIRLLGGTPGQATRMIALELAPTILVGRSRAPRSRPWP